MSPDSSPLSDSHVGDDGNARQHNFPSASSPLTLLGIELGLLFCGPTTALDLIALKIVFGYGCHICIIFEDLAHFLTFGTLSPWFVVSSCGNSSVYLKMAFLFLKNCFPLFCFLWVLMERSGV